ncbi:hypothetical protein ACEOPW_29690, partial [Pseudomonas aeruginosa]
KPAQWRAYVCRKFFRISGHKTYRRLMSQANRSDGTLPKGPLDSYDCRSLEHDGAISAHRLNEERLCGHLF